MEDIRVKVRIGEVRRIGKREGGRGRDDDDEIMQ